MGVYTRDREARKWSLSLLVYVFFNLYHGSNASEYCQTPEGVKECETGCCGTHWENNVSCCPFHPAAFIMIVMAIVLAIAFISYCIISAIKRSNRRKTVIKPHVSTDTSQVSSVSYVLVSPGFLAKYPSSLPPSYSDGHGWGMYDPDAPPTYTDNPEVYIPR